MKNIVFDVHIILAKCKRTKSNFEENAKITGYLISHFLMLVLPASSYTRTAGTATSIVDSTGFLGEQLKVCIWP